MVVLVIWKNEDPLKNEGTRVFTTLYINFSDTQWQITPESVVVSGQNLISSKLPCMSLLPARMKKIQLALECSQDFSHYRSMGIFPICRSNSAVHGRIWSNFKLVRDFMVVLATSKNEEDPIKNEGARVFTTYTSIFQTRKGR